MTWVSSMYLSREFNFLSCLTVSVIFFVEQVFSLKKKKKFQYVRYALDFLLLNLEKYLFLDKKYKIK